MRFIDGKYSLAQRAQPTTRKKAVYPQPIPVVVEKVEVIEVKSLQEAPIEVLQAKVSSNKLKSFKKIEKREEPLVTINLLEKTDLTDKELEELTRPEKE